MKKALFALTMVLLTISLAHAADIMFDKDTSYDIVYEISENILEEVTNAKISGTVEIGDTTFLVIETISSKKGYIKFNNIKSILSHGSFQRRREGKKIP